MRKTVLLVIIVLLGLAITSLVSCRSNNSRTQINYPPPIVLPPPIGADSDGDTISDNAPDCAPADPNYWAWLPFWPDLNGNNIPDSARFTQFCVGLPATYPEDWTPTPPPPLDPCRPVMKISFGFTSGIYNWTVYGNCFNDALPNPIAPDMGSGISNNAIIFGEPDPTMIIVGSCVTGIHFEPAITNSCGIVNWLPCQSGSGVVYSGLNPGDGLAYFNASLSPTCQATDEIQLPVAAEDNGQNGAWFRIGLTTGTTPDGDEVDIITSIGIDPDGDGFNNNVDNCVLVANPDQASNPGNLIGANGLRVGNLCLGIDTDNDGYQDGFDAFPFDATRH